jgi:alkanesulfonate monooxygenase SsuD/methylene tetrahydromethanopterin reductase-like flavin-dependent oxidoreductase (luciferase family)
MISPGAGSALLRPGTPRRVFDRCMGRHDRAVMEIGFQVWGQNVAWPELMDEARAIEARGFGSLWSNDHFWPAAGADAPTERGVPGGFLEGWMTLAGFAAVTSRIPLGVLVSGAGYRNPALVVKQATALDHMSAGRMTLGLGAGWHEREHRAFGFGFPSLGDRITRLEEQAGVIRRLLDGDSVTYRGQWIEMYGARNEPPQLGPLPLLIGGSGEKRTLAIVARYADAWNGEGDPATWARRNRLLDEHCERVGRDPGAIRRTVGAAPARIRATRQEAVASLADTLVANGLSPAEAHESAEASPLAGTAESVTAALHEWGAGGAAEVIIDWPAPFDHETLDGLAELTR